MHTTKFEVDNGQLDVQLELKFNCTIKRRTLDMMEAYAGVTGVTLYDALAKTMSKTTNDYIAEMNAVRLHEGLDVCGFVQNTIGNMWSAEIC